MNVRCSTGDSFFNEDLETEDGILNLNTVGHRDSNISDASYFDVDATPTRGTGKGLGKYF